MNTSQKPSMYKNIPKILTPEQIQEFQDDGIIVIPNILSPSEVKSSLEELENSLLQYGVDTNNLLSTGHNLMKLSSTNGSGGVLDVFYPDFKLDIATNEKLFQATCDLWASCFHHQSGQEMKTEGTSDTSKDEWMRHPFGPFDCRKGYAYIDRIGYRLPTTVAEQIGLSIQQEQQQQQNQNNGLKKKRQKKIAIQRSLTPHLDCCPDTIHSSNKTKWRPIQCFVSLTDNLQANSGGFEAVRGGFHKEFHNWRLTRPKSKIGKKNESVEVSPPCIGEYTHIRPKEDAEIIKRFEHIPVSAGSAVLWDNRIPHANSYCNDANVTRAAVYCSFLPDVEVNRFYAAKQLQDYKCGRIPRDQWIHITDNKGSFKCDETNLSDEKLYEKFHTGKFKFSSVGRKLMKIDEW